MQLKIKWDSLQNNWKSWKELIGKETSLGLNLRNNTVNASKERWKAKLQMWVVVEY